LTTGLPNTGKRKVKGAQIAVKSFKSSRGVKAAAAMFVALAFAFTNLVPAQTTSTALSVFVNSVVATSVTIAPGDQQSVQIGIDGSSLPDGRGILFDDNGSGIEVTQSSNTSTATGGYADFTLSVSSGITPGTYTVNFWSPPTYTMVAFDVVVADKYWVNFYDEYPSGNFIDSFYIYGNDSTLGNISDPTRDGYTFDGWYDSEGYYYSADTYLSAGVDLYAAWVGNDYTVNYDVNNGSSSADWSFDNYTYDGGSLTLPGVAAVPGYTFNGWYDGGTFIGNPGDTFDQPIGGANLTGDWSPNDLTLSYDTTGGSLSPDYYDYTYDGGSVTLPLPSKNGYSFDGWYDYNENLIGYNGDSVQLPTDNTTWYASWVPNNYSVYFYANYTDGVVYNSTYGFTYSEGQLQLATPQGRPGYHFDGWYDDDNGKYVGGAGDWVDQPTYDWFLYAQWTQNAAVTYSGNGGSTSLNSATYEGTDLVLPNASQDGQRFLGWFNDSVEGTFIGGFGDTWVPDGDATLYAQWAPFINVTYDANAGSSSLSSDQFGVDALQLPNATREGYHFDGWFDSEDNLVGQVGDNFSPEVDVTLYAGWTANANVFTVTYNAESGSSSVASADYSTVDLVLPNATRTDYTFTGWYALASGGDQIGIAGDTYEPEADTTLHAQWTLTNVPTPPAANGSKPFASFGVGSSKLTSSMKKAIRAFVAAHQGADHVVCVGYTEGPKSAADAKLARARGKATCSYIKSLEPTWSVSSKGVEGKVKGAKYRKVKVTLAGSPG
jgi:uncharacterized repeat protein (TIGR02543 family)